ncbi:MULTISPECIES: response regulator [Haloarcula]|uniref:response regulator n=1 Tax=Haloarcula TaxID=2237 RepID=UPI0023E79090|nr:response regulator [Halomicroarcula sp. SHR3]
MTAEEPDTSAQTTSVLLIDDEKEVRELYALYLGQRYTVQTASDGDVPVETVDDADIVFCDRRMPKQSGEEFLKRIRDAGLDVPVVFISAVDEIVRIDEEYQGYLTKPVDGETLTQSVMDHVPETDLPMAD